MTEHLLFDPTTQVLRKSLDLRAKNQQIIAANVANAETPGYAPAKFSFEDALSTAISASKQPALAAPHPKHFPLGPTSLAAVQGEITREADTTGIGDKNGVSVDEEMIALAQNELLFETSAQLLQKKFSLLRHVISGQ